MGGRIWLDACSEFARRRGIEASYVDALHAFAYPHPRGGPPPPPEPAWTQDFETLERDVGQPRLSEPGVRAALERDLAAEVDAKQAQMFGRRIAAVEQQLGDFGDATGRLLAVGLRQRLRGILAAPRPRALRVRALADYYYSYAGRWLHARSRTEPAPSVGHAVRSAPWSSVAPGVELARVEGVYDVGPVHAHLLRLRPGSVRARVVDCRAAVRAGVTFADYTAEQGALAAVSGGFFLYSEPDIEPPSARYDPVGLLVDGGVVLNPPTFSRGALVFDAQGRWEVGRVGVRGVRVHGRAGTAALQGCVTRAQAELGPAQPSVAIAAGRVVAVGTSLPVPLNGFVVGSTGVWSVGESVRFSSPLGPSDAPVHSGIAGGPLLLSEGRVDIDLQAEGFWGTAPPLTFSQDETGDRNSLPRLAAGTDEAGNLVLAAVDGRNFTRALGMTLRQLAELMRSVGCVQATNLDGGSSKRMVVQSKTLDLPSTEIEQRDPGGALVRPVHTAVLFLPSSQS